MSWTPAQQAMLSAMGLALYVRVRPDAAPAPAPRPAPDAAASDPLHRALLRAARGGDLTAVLPPLATLRADPAAKRALWPVLRALRRG